MSETTSFKNFKQSNTQKTHTNKHTHKKTHTQTESNHPICKIGLWRHLRSKHDGYRSIVVQGTEEWDVERGVGAYGSQDNLIQRAQLKTGQNKTENGSLHSQSSPQIYALQ